MPKPEKNGKNTFTKDGKPMYHSPTDLLGSYTGRPEDPYEEPVQDADDL